MAASWHVLQLLQTVARTRARLRPLSATDLRPLTTITTTTRFEFFIIYSFALPYLTSIQLHGQAIIPRARGVRSIILRILCNLCEYLLHGSGCLNDRSINSSIGLLWSYPNSTFFEDALWHFGIVHPEKYLAVAYLTNLPIYMYIKNKAWKW